ncbi:MAG TPA: lamin tail domain-containing protein [Gammaproteobacteria bacterium]|nr:lamin tail domain-containing protein [Gammaproteobacteria bacterium]
MNNSVHTYCTITSLVVALSSSLSVAHAAIRTPGPSDLVISEVMANPSAVSDRFGEWFELFNPTMDSLVLNNLVLSDNGSNQHQITAANDLLINSGQYFVLARNGDTNINGGVVADYVYSGFSLNNTSDAIIISSDNIEITRLEYSAGFVKNGKSTELFSLPSEIDDYQTTPDNLTYGVGDTGTPGVAGSSKLMVSAVPVPAAIWLFASGLIGVCSIGKKKKG